MKVTVEVKDAPKYRRVETVTMDVSIHSRVTVADIVKAIRAPRPWAKIIDIRLDLR